MDKISITHEGLQWLAADNWLSEPVGDTTSIENILSEVGDHRFYQLGGLLKKGNLINLATLKTNYEEDVYSLGLKILSSVDDNSIVAYCHGSRLYLAFVFNGVVLFDHIFEGKTTVGEDGKSSFICSDIDDATKNKLKVVVSEYNGKLSSVSSVSIYGDIRVVNNRIYVCPQSELLSVGGRGVEINESKLTDIFEIRNDKSVKSYQFIDTADIKVPKSPIFLVVVVVLLMLTVLINLWPEPKKYEPVASPVKYIKNPHQDYVNFLTIQSSNVAERLLELSQVLVVTERNESWELSLLVGSPDSTNVALEPVQDVEVRKQIRAAFNQIGFESFDMDGEGRFAAIRKESRSVVAVSPRSLVDVDENTVIYWTVKSITENILKGLSSYWDSDNYSVEMEDLEAGEVPFYQTEYSKVRKIKITLKDVTWRDIRTLGYIPSMMPVTFASAEITKGVSFGRYTGIFELIIVGA